MIGMTKVSIILFIAVILSGCMKTTCVTDTHCEKKVDWNNPKFSIMRTILTNGTNLGK
jgi:PBP1b-binding outer membrane lipoprotein LpoB